MKSSLEKTKSKLTSKATLDLNSPREGTLCTAVALTTRINEN